MILHGLGKLTLLDYPGYLACTAFTGACNFRCPFCHNAPLVLSPDTCDQISEEAFFAFLSSRKGRLEGVCVTGGEPTLQPDLPEFLAKIKAMGFFVKLDTNGYRPEVLEFILSNHLADMVAMDIKNSKEQYALTAGLANAAFCPEHIEESIRLLLRYDIPHEFRTTVVKELHDADNMLSVGIWLSELASSCQKGPACPSPYYLQSFKEADYLICGKSSQYHAHPEETMQSFVSLLKPYLPNTSLRGQ